MGGDGAPLLIIRNAVLSAREHLRIPPGGFPAGVTANCETRVSNFQRLGCQDRPESGLPRESSTLASASWRVERNFAFLQPPGRVGQALVDVFLLKVWVCL